MGGQAAGRRWSLTASPRPQNHLQILLLLVFEAIVYRRQEHQRRLHQMAPLPAQAVCASGTRQQLDRDLLGCLRYFINFFFYKFGLEVRPLPLPWAGRPWGLLAPSGHALSIGAVQVLGGVGSCALSRPHLERGL